MHYHHRKPFSLLSVPFCINYLPPAPLRCFEYFRTVKDGLVFIYKHLFIPFVPKPLHLKCPTFFFFRGAGWTFYHEGVDFRDQPARGWSLNCCLFLARNFLSFRRLHTPQNPNRWKQLGPWLGPMEMGSEIRQFESLFTTDFIPLGLPRGQNHTTESWGNIMRL